MEELSIIEPDKKYKYSYDNPLCSDPIMIDLTGPLPIITFSTTTAAGQQPQSSEKKFIEFLKDAPQCPIRIESCGLATNYISPEEGGVTVPANFTPEITLPQLDSAKGFISRNFFGLVVLSHLVGVAFLLAVKPIQSILLRMGSLHKKENTLKRYLTMIWTLVSLYKCDLIIDPGSQNKKDSNGTVQYSSATQEQIKELRKLEEKIGKNFSLFLPPPLYSMKLSGEEERLLKALKVDLLTLQEQQQQQQEVQLLLQDNSTINPQLPLSQYTLALVQFTFVGFISLFSNQFGIYEQKGMEEFIQFWGVIGRELGLEDRFNLCFLGADIRLGVYEKIFRSVFLQSLKNGDENLLKLWRTMCSGSCRYFNFFRTKALLLFMLRDVVGMGRLEGEEIRALMNWGEKLSYHFVVLMVRWGLWFRWSRALMNFSAKMVFCLGYRCYLRKLRKGKYNYDFEMFNRG